MFRNRPKHKFLATGLITLIFVIFPFLVSASTAAGSVSYDFNTAGDLVGKFNSYVTAPTSSVSQSATGGIGGTGAINAPGNANAVFASKDSYTISNGSTYTFTSFLQSIGNSGYSGMGFTSLLPGSANVRSFPVFRPSDAIGVSVHGGGFEFHNGATNTSGSWNADNAGITTITKSSLPDLLNSGSVSDWYKVVLKISITSATTFDMRVEIWPSDSSGTLLNTSAADAIFELPNQSSTLLSEPSISSYVNFSGDRVRYFDNYSVDLTGGAAVVTGHTVNYNVAGGSAVANKYFPEGVTNSFALPTTTKTGYVLSGWFDAATDGTKQGNAGDSFSTTSLTSDVNLFAQWTPGSYAINYNTDGGTPQASGTYLSDTQMTLPAAPTKPGYSFTGWFSAISSGTKLGDAEANYTPGHTGASITVFARWAKKTYAVNYNTAGGSSQAAGSYQSDTAFTLASMPTRTGYTFSGWFDALTAGTRLGNAGVAYNPGHPDSDLNVFAQWSADTHAVSYDTGGGSNQASGTYQSDTIFRLPTAPSKQGFVFTGWFDAATGGNKVGDANALYTPRNTGADIQLFAQWEAVPQVAAQTSSASVVAEPVLTETGSSVLTLWGLGAITVLLGGVALIIRRSAKV